MEIERLKGLEIQMWKASGDGGIGNTMEQDRVDEKPTGAATAERVVGGQSRPMTLTDYLLSHLAQECAEVVVRCTKAQHFGLDEVQPEQQLTNRERLQGEVADMMAMVEILTEHGIFEKGWSGLTLAIMEKRKKAARFRGYSRTLGRVE